MNILEIIAKKRDGQKITKQEIEYFVEEYTKGNITDYQAAALLMAIYIQKMDEEETTYLALAMAKSGDVLDLSSLGNVVDKHSTGGIGDKVTLILAPIIATFEIPVAKMSGRGLGYTGGTIDKLESIPGYQTSIPIENFIENVEKIGISIIGQTLNLAPADKKLYALRDTTSCVENISLIASSIMSKKIAAGANKIVLDVTCGSGAFMKNIEQATHLAEMMNKIGKLANKQTVCVITNMQQPLGKYVGNILEIVEVIEALHDKWEEDVKEVVLELGAYMIKLAGYGENIEENKQRMLENVKNGKAFAKLKELIQNQGGDVLYLEYPEKFTKATYQLPVTAEKSGYVEQVIAEQIGKASVLLGAGRMKKEDDIDKTVGIELHKKVGSQVVQGEIIAYIHANDQTKANEAVEQVKSAYKISEKCCESLPSILKIVE